MARFFIDRPVFAWVLAIAVMLAGTLAVATLPVAQYPEIAPPAVTISAEYPGASAEVVENSVIQIIEQAMTGLDNFQAPRKPCAPHHNTAVADRKSVV